MTIIIAKFAPVVTDLFGIFNVFYFFLMTSLFGALYMNKYGVEILGKERKEIKKEFIARRKVKWLIIFKFVYYLKIG